MTPARIPLGRLLTASRAKDHPVTIRGADDSPRTFGDLERHVGSLVVRIRDEPRGRWVVHAQGAFEMAAALLSVWQVGSSALVAPNARPDTLAALAGDAIGTISDDAALGESLDVVRVRDDPGAAALDWREIPPAHGALELLTSGTTSARKRIGKALGQLDAELEAHERFFGPQLGRAEIVSTVSHQHLYGLLFELLWPLSAGRAFHDTPCLHPSEVCARVAAASDGAVVVGAPVHLQRLAEHRGVAEAGPGVREIFSSGGPLDPASADALEAAMGRAPVEIYGSTETGGIAWRRQSASLGAERLRWTPFDAVEIARDDAGETLRVRSPFASAPGSVDRWVETSDRVELCDDGRFLLRGRADRVVKVGEKPVSLPDLESQLGDHPAVVEAACLRVDRKPVPRIAAVVVLSAEGHALLERGGRSAVADALLRHLGGSWDRVVLPRVWRYVDRLPRDPLGKLSVAALAELVEAPATRGGPRSPEILDEAAGPGFLEREVRVPADLAHLLGHFPGHPVVPGVAQIGWVVAILRGPLGVASPIDHIDALKFNHVIRPGDRVRIRVERKGDAQRWVFRLWSDAQVFSSGRIVVSEEA